MFVIVATYTAQTDTDDGYGSSRWETKHCILGVCPDEGTATKLLGELNAKYSFERAKYPRWNPSYKVLPVALVSSVEDMIAADPYSLLPENV